MLGTKYLPWYHTFVFGIFYKKFKILWNLGKHLFIKSKILQRKKILISFVHENYVQHRISKYGRQIYL